MGKIETRLDELGLILPPELQIPQGVILPFPTVNIRGNCAFISGCAALDAQGRLAGPFGQVGRDVSVADANTLARGTALCMISSLKRELGELDRITGWCKALGMVNSAPGFTDQPAVVNGFTDLILQVFGPDIGRHARSAVGMAALPMGIAVEIEAEVLIDV